MFFFGGGQNSRQGCPVQAAGGTCWKNGCKYSHDKEDMPICRRWQEGGCIGGRGNNCQLRHYYKETDKVVTHAKRFQDSEGGPSENVDFSSPYRVKVVKEVEKQRMEEVDLDTGKRRSWIETKEFDVYDLTGDTPAKPKPPLMDKTNNRNPITNLAKSIKLASLESTESPGASTPIVLKSVRRSEDESTCPVCQRQFKNARGVKSHRSSKNSNCKVGKENLENGNISPIKAMSLNGSTGPSQEERAASSVRTDTNQSESIIVIGDTPEIPVNRRRSTRLAVIL